MEYELLNICNNNIRALKREEKIFDGSERIIAKNNIYNTF